MKTIRSIADLHSGQVNWILDRAWQHRQGVAVSSVRPNTVIGLAFFEASLRTRVGFAAAAARLGVTSVEILQVRSSAASMPESIEDTLRVLSDYSDVLVVRVGEPLSIPSDVTVPVLNGGDGGPGAEHPSQSLIDVFAFQNLAVDLCGQTIALCGDLRMRAARSLLLLMVERRPNRLVLVTEPPLTDGFELPYGLDAIADFRPLNDIGDVDALYVVGIPHGALEENGRSRLRVTTEHLDRLPRHAGVFSPLPVIDEIERSAISHPRVRMFEQSANGLYVRMAVLEFLLDDAASIIFGLS
jgi:aspartate carbamoyltransferase catalytic subunit